MMKAKVKITDFHFYISNSNNVLRSKFGVNIRIHICKCSVYCALNIPELGLKIKLQIPF